MGDKLREELIVKWRERQIKAEKVTAVTGSPRYEIQRCADELEALLAESQPAPIVTVTQGAPPGCTADAIARSGKWQTFEQPAPPSLSEISPLALQEIGEAVHLMGLTGFTYWFEFCERLRALKSQVSVTGEPK